MKSILQRRNAATYFLVAVISSTAGLQQAAAYDVCVDGGRDPHGAAYEDSSCVHEDMASYGAWVHYNNHNPFEYDDLLIYTSYLREGAGHEDEKDHIYGETGNSLTVGHFWDPDPGGVFTPLKQNRLDGAAWFLGSLPNGWQKSQAYWARALGEFVAGQMPSAYHNLGHVVHHVGDNTIPTHVSVITHAPGNRDSFENWMSNKYHINFLNPIGPQDFGSDTRTEYYPPTYNHKLTRYEESALNYGYQPLLERIDPLEYADLNTDIPEVAGVETPDDKLLWLLYTTNQIAEFFAADRNNAFNSDGEGEFNDPTNWAQGDLNKMVAAGLRPTTVDQMDDDDSCDCDADPHKDLSTIREYSYLRGIRAIGGLYNMFQQTVKTKPLLSIEISALNVMLPNGTCNDGAIRDACDLFARVKFSDVTPIAFPIIVPVISAENYGDMVLDKDHQYTPAWKWGHAVEESGFVRIQLQVWDDDGFPFTDVPVRITPESSDDSDGGKVMNLLVDLSKCLRGEAGGITVTSVLGTPLGGQIGTSLCNQSQTTSVTGNEDENDGIVRVTFAIKMVEFLPPLITCAAVDDTWHADNISIACTASDSGVGLANAADATFSLVTDVPEGTETDFASTNSLPICDTSGNCATAGPIRGPNIDRKAPELTAPDGVAIEATGPGSPVDIGMASASDLSGITSLTNDSPTQFPVGTTVVTWTAVDGVGRTSTAQQDIVVVDTTPPVITAPPDVKITARREGEPIGEATAEDVVGIKAISSDAPALFSPGKTIVTWYAMDDAGNISIATQVVSAKKKGGGATGLSELLVLLTLIAIRHRRRRTLH